MGVPARDPVAHEPPKRRGRPSRCVRRRKHHGPEPRPFVVLVGRLGCEAEFCLPCPKPWFRHSLNQVPQASPCSVGRREDEASCLISTEPKPREDGLVELLHARVLVESDEAGSENSIFSLEKKRWGNHWGSGGIVPRIVGLQVVVDPLVARHVAHNGIPCREGHADGLDLPV